MGEFDRVDVGRRVPGNVRRDAVELVEAVRGRQALRLGPEMPLAEDRGGVAERRGTCRPSCRRAQRACSRCRERSTSDRPLRIEYCPVISAARDGVQAGSTRYCVSRMPSLGELVDARRRRAAQFAAAVGAEVTVADIVGDIVISNALGAVRGRAAGPRAGTTARLADPSGTRRRPPHRRIPDVRGRRDRFLDRGLAPLRLAKPTAAKNPRRDRFFSREAAAFSDAQGAMNSNRLGTRAGRWVQPCATRAPISAFVMRSPSKFQAPSTVWTTLT